MFAKSGMSAGWRRACILFLLLLVLAGCRKNAGLVVSPGQGTVSGSGEAALTGILTGVYRGEEIPLPKQVYIRSQNMGPGGIRMDRETREVTVWTMDAEGHGHIVTVKGEDVTTDDTIFDIPEDRVLQAAAFGEHCFVWVTAVYADRRFSGEEVHRIDLDTREETVRDNVRDLFATAERQEGEYGRFQITSAAVDPDGDLWLAAGEEVVVLSSNFVLRTSFVSRGYSSSLSIAPDGLVWVPSSDGAAVLDKKTGQSTAVRLGTSPSAIVFGEGYDFYFETDQGVYGMTEDGSVLLMDYPNSNVMEGSLRLCGAIDPETLLFAEDERIMLYKSLGDIDLSAVPTIEVVLNAIGSMAYQRSMDIVEYNKSHPETRVLVTDYTQYNTDENPKAGSQRLATDLLTGTIKPDIVIAAPRGYYSRQAGTEIEVMLDHHLYTDLSGFLETDPDLNPENLFGAVRRYFTAADGGMWGISSGFQVSTLFGPTALLEKWSDGNGSSSKGWTLTEMLDYADSLPSDSYLIGQISRETAVNKLLGPDGYSAFIDRENAACSFDNPEFLRWLKFLYALPDTNALSSGSTPEYVGLRADTAEYYYTGHVALESDVLSMTDLSVESLEAWFGTKDWTIIGFPAEGHNGSYVECEEAILMTSFCSKKDLAWDVIRTLVTGFDVFLPVMKQTYEERVAEDVEQGAYMMLKLKHDENGWGRITSRSSASSHNSVFPTMDDLDCPGWISIPTAEDFARFEAFLDNDAGYPLTERISPEINEIIEEEISAFFAGVGSAEDCAKKIQSRVSIWLAEHH